MLDNVTNSVFALLKDVGCELLTTWPGNPNRIKELEIISKPDGTKVTDADLRANEKLLATLKEILPGHFIVSEEGPNICFPNIIDLQPSNLPKKSIILDPLDGTGAYIEGRGDFSILVGELVNGLPSRGWMYFPALGIDAVGEIGVGAVSNGEPLKVSTAEKLRDHSLFFRKCALPSKKSFVFPDPCDSGYALIRLAQGEFDAVVIRMLTHRDWDTLAPSVLVLEAGGRISDEQGNKIQFGHKDPPYKYFVATNGKVHDEVLSLLPDAIDCP